MQLIRYRTGGGAPQVGILDGDRVRPLPGVATMADLLARPVTWIRGACETLLAGGTLDPGDGAPGAAAPPGGTGAPGPVPGGAQAACLAPGTGQDQVPLRRITVLAPVDGETEVWAAGVTYERSMHARVQESRDSADIYDRVYSAPRPELFFKSAAWRVAGPGDPVSSARADSQVDVPEPELAAVLNAGGRGGRLHDLQRHELPVDRGGEPALPAPGQDLPGWLRGRARGSGPPGRSLTRTR